MTGWEIVETLGNGQDFKVVPVSLQKVLLENLGHIRANDEHRSPEPRPMGVEHRIVHERSGAGTDRVELFEAAVPAAETCGENHEGGG